MEMIRGRTLPEVRRYDLWKLLIAALLFINALFICGKPALAPEQPKAPPSASVPIAATVLLAAGYAWSGDKLVLSGVVKDEATRKALVDEAVKTMGSPERVLDQLSLDANAGALPWYSRLADLMGWGKGKADTAIKVKDKLAVLTGTVASELEKKARGDAAAAILGPDVVIDNQLQIDLPKVAALPLPPQAKVYFANNKTEVSAKSVQGLSEVMAWAKASKDHKLAVSGFHSASGSPEHNHELAKGRALEVAAILKHAGVPEAQIELRKPTAELGGVRPDEARRVEVGPAQ
jgi:outer membrane protein OmpA-like peptidoglycan-associated protein